MRLPGGRGEKTTVYEIESLEKDFERAVKEAFEKVPLAEREEATRKALLPFGVPEGALLEAARSAAFYGRYAQPSRHFAAFLFSERAGRGKLVTLGGTGDMESTLDAMIALAETVAEMEGLEEVQVARTGSLGVFTLVSALIFAWREARKLGLDLRAPLGSIPLPEGGLEDASPEALTRAVLEEAVRRVPWAAFRGAYAESARQEIKRAVSLLGDEALGKELTRALTLGEMGRL